MLVGWQAIGAAMDGASKETLIRWAKEEGFPLAYVGHTPCTTEKQITAWIEKRVKHYFSGNRGYSGGKSRVNRG